MKNNGILIQTRQFVADWYLQHADPNLTMHNLALTQKLVSRVAEVAEAQQISEEITTQAIIATLFSQTGFTLDYDQAIAASTTLLDQFLDHSNLTLDQRQNILNTLIPSQNSPQALLYQDAWNSHVLGDGLATYQPLYRTEIQLVRQTSLTKAKARGWFFAQSKHAKLHYPYTQAKYQGILMENTANLVRLTNKNLSKELEETQLFGGITGNNPSREVQTYFRTSFDYHTKLVDISDNKARIMISVNSILVSILISLLTYNYQRVATSVNTMVIVPILIFLIAAVGSLIFAILSSRPMQSQSTKSQNNLFSFMEFMEYSKEEYQKQMNEVLRDGATILTNMTAAIYSLGSILDKKYRYLTLSYNIFMVGFVVSVAMFVVIYFF